MIREATEADIPAIVEMGRAFNAASRSPVEYDEEQAAEAARGLIALPDGVVLVSEKGMIGGAIAPAYFNAAWRMAVELFWWSEDRQGIRLLRAFEDWAREHGANEVRMTTLASIAGPERILKRRGYSPAEISYTRAI